MKTYSYHTIPVWNMWQLNVSGDIKFLVVAEQYDYDSLELDELKRDELKQLYEKNFLHKYEDIPELLISGLAMTCCQLLLGWRALKNKEAEKAFNQRFNEYCEQLGKVYENFEYENGTYELNALLKHINNQMNEDIKNGANLVELKLKYAEKKYFATSYISAIKQPKNKSDIMDMVLYAEKITSQNIDYYTFPYIKLKRIITNNLKQQNNGSRTN